MKIIKSKNKKGVLISVIIPTFNAEYFLEKVIFSIKHQTFKKHELIVSDGESSDNTIKIAKKYADKIVSSNERGVAYQQNNGAEVAKGDILMYVHQDVALAPNYLDSVLKAANKGYILGKGKTLPNGNSFVLNNYFKLNNLSDNFASKFDDFFGLTHFFIKRDLLMKHKFKQELYWDVDMIKRINKLGKLIFLKDTYGKSLDFIYEKGRNLVIFKGKKVSFWRIVFIRYLFFGALSRLGLKFKH